MTNPGKSTLITTLLFAAMLLTAVAAIASWTQIKANIHAIDVTKDQYDAKARLVLRMWDILRERENVLQKMLVTQDPFERDDLYIKHMQLASDYMILRDELTSMEAEPAEIEYIKTLNSATQKGAPVQNKIREHIVSGDIEKAINDWRGEQYQQARRLIFEQLEKLFYFYQDNHTSVTHELNQKIIKDAGNLLMLMAVIMLSTGGVGYYILAKLSKSEDALREENRRHVITKARLETHQKSLQKDIEDAVSQYRKTALERDNYLNIERMFNDILEFSINEIYLFNSSDYTFRLVNECARANLGYSMDELDELKPYDIVMDITDNEFRELIEIADFSDKKTSTFYAYFRRKDGSHYPVELHVQKLSFGKEDVYVMVALDITDLRNQQTDILQKQKEIDNVTNELAYQKIALSEHASVCVIDSNKHIEIVNDKFCTMTGYDMQNLVGKSFFSLTDYVEQADDANAIDNTISRGDIWHGELQLHTCGGDSRPTKSTITPFYNEDAEIYKYVIVCTDISEQKAVLREMEIVNKTLHAAKEELMERTLEIEKAHKELEKSHAVMLQSEKLASVGQLAAGIAHEINTPIQFVGDNTRFLQDAFEDVFSLLGEYEQLASLAEEQKMFNDAISSVKTTADEVEIDYLAEEIPSAIKQTLNGVDRVRKIVLSMKEFSHPGVENIEYIDLNHAIESTINVSRNEWKYVAEMDTDFDDTLVSVPCYAGELNQTILNIIVNAAHAIADSRNEEDLLGKISIATLNTGDTAKITISDTGTGMPDEVKNKIFEPFFTTKSVGKGTGQGLAIAYSVIVEKHGGQLQVDTEVGKGTVFTIHLPLHHDKADSDNTPDIINQEDAA